MGIHYGGRPRRSPSSSVDDLHSGCPTYATRSPPAVARRRAVYTATAASKTARTAKRSRACLSTRHSAHGTSRRSGGGGTRKGIPRNPGRVERRTEPIRARNPEARPHRDRTPQTTRPHRKPETRPPNNGTPGTQDQGTETKRTGTPQNLTKWPWKWSPGLILCLDSVCFPEVSRRTNHCTTTKKLQLVFYFSGTREPAVDAMCENFQGCQPCPTMPRAALHMATLPRCHGLALK